jgi:rhodanese-related sulfurtransferase
MKTIALYFALLFLSYNTIAAQRSPNTLSPAEFKLRCANAHGILLDVRTPEEYLASTIPGAININVMDPDYFASHIKKLDKNKTYFLFCGTGMRSSEAMEEMKKAGFLKVYELDGGLTAWEKYDLPLD